MAGKGSEKLVETQLSVDAEAWISQQSPSAVGPTTNFTSHDISMDAMPGRRHQVPGGRLRTSPGQREMRPPLVLEDRVPPESRQANTENRQASPSVKKPKFYTKQDSEDDLCQQLTEKLQDLEVTDDSTYGSFSSSESSACSLTSTLSLEEEIEKYKSKMPTGLKAPYIDVLILYAEDDRDEAEDFRQHLINDIDLPDKTKVAACLYDCPEFIGLSGSSFQHLELAVERSTYVFVYLTKQFVECKWCEISSESCLMKAIYDAEKRWCVVPVYTQRRNKCNFKIPMGINSLKGINYYNKDEFYRNGVARLIGDKADVKVRMENALKSRQKTWIEQYKRKLEMQKNEELKNKHRQEEETRALKAKLEKDREIWMQEKNFPWSFSESDLSSPMHHSLSSNSLKDPQQHPRVAEYFNDLKNQNLNHVRFQYGPPPPYTSAAYNQHGVKRSTSQMSNVSHDGVPIPTALYEKIKDCSPEEQAHYLSFLRQEAVMCQQQRPSIPAMYPQEGQHNLLNQQQQQSLQYQLQSQGYHGNQQISHPLLNANPNQNFQADPLLSAPPLSMESLKTQDGQGHNTAVPQSTPNFEALSLNSYHPDPPSTSVRGYNTRDFSSSSSEQSSAIYTGSEGRGQSVDGPLSSHQAGNVPNLSMFSMTNQSSSQPVSINRKSTEIDSQYSSLEQDSASISPIIRAQHEKQEMLESSSEEKGVASSTVKKEKVVKTSKGNKNVYYTINIYEATNVQVGESNKVIVPDSDTEDEETDDDDADDNLEETAGKNSMRSVPTNPKSSQGSSNQGQRSEVDSHVTTDALSATQSTLPTPQSTLCTPQPTNNLNQPKTFKNNLDSPTMTKHSEGKKQVGKVSPRIQSSRDSSPFKGDKDETIPKSVVPTSQTLHKTVNSADNQPQNIIPPSVLDSPKRESINSVNMGSQGQQNMVRPMQINRPNFGSLNISNTENFYSKFQSVQKGEDPLQRETGGRDLPEESNGFNPNTNPEDEIDEDYDMVEHDNYEGGVLAESVEEPTRSNPGGKLDFLRRFTRIVTK